MKRPLALATLALMLAAASSALADDPPAPAPAAEADALRPEAAPPQSEGDTSHPKLRYPPSSVRPKLIVGGLAISGLAYAAAFGTASNWPEVPGSGGLKIPILGPWLALGHSGCAPDDADCGAKVYVRGILYVIDGIAQLAGLGLISEGIFMKTEASAPPKKSVGFDLPGGITLHPAPLVTARVTGLGFVGSF